MRLSALMLCLLVASPAIARPPAAEEQVKRTAMQFGQALVRGELSEIAGLLPEGGKVRMRLIQLAPDQGSYSAEHVVAILRDAMRRSNVVSFSLVNLECAGNYALAGAQLRLNDETGRALTIDLHLQIEPEKGRWVLREIRETPP